MCQVPGPDEPGRCPMSAVSAQPFYPLCPAARPSVFYNRNHWSLILTPPLTQPHGLKTPGIETFFFNLCTNIEHHTIFNIYISINISLPLPPPFSPLTHRTAVTETLTLHYSYSYSAVPALLDGEVELMRRSLSDHRWTVGYLNCWSGNVDTWQLVSVPWSRTASHYDYRPAVSPC